MLLPQHTLTVLSCNRVWWHQVEHLQWRGSQGGPGDRERHQEQLQRLVSCDLC
jgi:hypothetical protein